MTELTELKVHSYLHNPSKFTIFLGSQDNLYYVDLDIDKISILRDMLREAEHLIEDTIAIEDVDDAATKLKK